MNHQPSNRRRSERGLALPALLFGIPMLAGALFLFVGKGVIPLAQWNASQDWTPTPCRIVEVKTTWDTSKTIATVAIKYAYEAAGRSHESTRYDFGNHRFNDEETARLIASHEPTSKTRCYVDPDDASESVLSLEYNSHYTGGLLIGGLFMLIGGALSWVGFRWRSQSMSVASNLMSSG